MHQLLVASNTSGKPLRRDVKGLAGGLRRCQCMVSRSFLSQPALEVTTFTTVDIFTASCVTHYRCRRERLCDTNSEYSNVHGTSSPSSCIVIFIPCSMYVRILARRPQSSLIHGIRVNGIAHLRASADSFTSYARFAFVARSSQKGIAAALYIPLGTTSVHFVATAPASRSLVSLSLGHL